MKYGFDKPGFTIFTLLVCGIVILLWDSVCGEDSNFGSVINPDKYIVGPGDKFKIDFWSGSTEPIEMTVTPEGFFLIESMGKVDVGNLTLTEARQELSRLVRKYYAEDDFSISLNGIRSVQVLVTGKVKNPSLYNGLASNRVSEMIAKAGGLSTGASRRNIRIGSGKGFQTVDLIKFERTGDLEANPYLYSGNIIHVPTVNDSSDFVQVSGEVVSPGGFEYADEDDLGTLIDLAYGLTGLEGDTVFVFRNSRGESKAILLSTDDRDFKILPADKIVVSRAEKDASDGYVTIVGEVNIPGRYPWHSQMNLSTVLETAGSLKAEADIYSLVIYRKAKYTRDSDVADALGVSSMNNISFSGGYEPVSMDIEQYFPDKLNKISMQPEDSVVVPRLTGFIGVYGMVCRPGAVAYEQPVRASDLISRAGGYGAGANHGTVRLIRKTSGMNIVAKPSIKVYDGDIIIIPEASDKKSLWDKIKDISLIVGGIGVAWLAIDNIAD